MPNFLKKQLEYNKEGFHASHVIDCSLSIVPIFPHNKNKSPIEDQVILTITTKERSEKQERSAFISLNSDELKSLRNLLNSYIKE